MSQCIQFHWSCQWHEKSGWRKCHQFLILFHQLAELSGVSREAFEADLAERTLLKRLPKVAEVADAAVLMASDRASAMTGTVANVTCGGTVD